MKSMKELKVLKISLVKSPATMLSAVYKSASVDVPNVTLEAVLKANVEKRLLYAIAYPAGRADVHDHFAESPVIEKACHDFMHEMRLREVDKEHDYINRDVEVVECGICRGSDAILKDARPGDWVVVMKVNSDEILEQIKKKEITGVSIAGLAMLETVKSADGGDDDAATVMALIAKVAEALGIKKPDGGSRNREDEDTMDEKVLKAAVEAAVKPLSDSVTALTARIDGIEKSVKEKPADQKPEGGKEEDVKKAAEGKTPEAQLAELQTVIKGLKDDLETVKKNAAGRVTGTSDTQTVARTSMDIL